MSKNPKPGGRSDHVDFKVALRGTKPEDEVPELIAIAAARPDRRPDPAGCAWPRRCGAASS